MTTLAIVQARMTSSRFPGKVLAPIDDLPMIIRQLRRIEHAERIDKTVVATSSDVSDDPLVEVLQAEGYPVIRGPLTDVLERFRIAIHEERPEVIVRITADCPLISPKVIDHVIHAFHEADVDYASNTLNPTYPDGLDVEVFRSSALESLSSFDLDSDEREHVTLGMYRRPEHFSLLSVEDPGRDHSDLRWTVDTAEDLDFVRWVYTQLGAIEIFEYDDVLDLLTRHPAMSRTAADGMRNAALAGKDTGQMRGVGP